MEQVLYNLPDGWEWVQLGKALDVRDGTHDSPKYVESGYPLVTSKNLTGKGFDVHNVKYISQKDFDAINKRSKVDVGDILFAMIGTIGFPTVINDEPNYAIKNVALFKKRQDDQNMDFFKYFLESPYATKSMLSQAKGAAQKFVGLKVLRSFNVPLPPKSEQKRIVEKLDALLTRIDTAIEHLQESVALADALYASALRQAFRLYGAVNKKGIRYELPKGWEWTPINKVTQKTNNLNPLKEKDKSWTYIDISSINREKFIVSEPKIILGKDAPSRAKKHVQKGDILFATTRPNLKNIAMLKSEYDSPVASTGFCILRATDEVLPEYLFYFVTTGFLQHQIEPYIGGASYPAITDSNLKKALIPIPEIDEQKRIIEKMNVLQEKNQTSNELLLEKITALNRLKASILDSAFKGQL